MFLGAAQHPEDIDRSLDRLKPLLKGREADPPLVVLMSRSELLHDKKADFRDRAQLLGALFRVYRKAELIEGSNLERVLERLARHRPDAVRVAAFIDSWQKGLADASERFITGIRRLDLSDYGQIREVLLNFEGQPLGSYLFDIFDRVLQHEIEGDATTVKLASQLNEINPDLYPAPHIAGSTDLQNLVYRTIWQNPKRLGVKTTFGEMPVGFGDVLVKRSLISQPSAVNDADPDAFVVLTPACDLARDGGAKRVLLLAGNLVDLTSGTWTYKGAPLKTPIVILPGERRMSVRWDVKNVRMLLPTEITSLLGEAGKYDIVLRFRESHALELQQRLLTDLGRVGLVAHMPATFPVNIAVYFVAIDSQLRQLKLDAANRDGGVCYIGRDAKGGENTRLVLTEPVIDELLTAVAAIAEDTIHQDARASLKRLKASTTLSAELQKGLKVPTSGKAGFAQIKETGLDETGKLVEDVIGQVGRNLSEVKPDARNGALVLLITDQTSANAPAPERPAAATSQSPDHAMQAPGSSKGPSRPLDA